MGLIGGMARTAVIAGTATAVSNRVSRRQAARWSEEDQSSAPPPPPPPQYAAPPPQYAPPPPQYAPPPPAPASAAPAGNDLSEQIQKLAGLRDAGILTEQEFAAAKAKLIS
jgi:hypothetical protein